MLSRLLLIHSPPPWGAFGPEHEVRLREPISGPVDDPSVASGGPGVVEVGRVPGEALGDGDLPVVLGLGVGVDERAVVDPLAAAPWRDDQLRVPRGVSGRGGARGDAPAAPLAFAAVGVGDACQDLADRDPSPLEVEVRPLHSRPQASVARSLGARLASPPPRQASAMPPPVQFRPPAHVVDCASRTARPRNGWLGSPPALAPTPPAGAVLADPPSVVHLTEAQRELIRVVDHPTTWSRWHANPR